MEAAVEEQTTHRAALVLMPLPAVEAKTGLKKTTIYALMKREGDERFPSPIRVLKRNVLWVQGDVDRWISERITCSLRAESARRAV